MRPQPGAQHGSERVLGSSNQAAMRAQCAPTFVRACWEAGHNPAVQTPELQLAGLPAALQTSRNAIQGC